MQIYIHGTHTHTRIFFGVEWTHHLEQWLSHGLLRSHGLNLQVVKSNWGGMPPNKMAILMWTMMTNQ